MSDDIKPAENEDFKYGEVFKSIPKIMEEMDAVGKNRKTNAVNGPNYAFRGIDDMYNALQKIMGKHGVFSVAKILDVKRFAFKSKSGTDGSHAIITYRFRFFGSDGSWVDQQAIGEAMDYGDKVSNKCYSIADKYALLGIFKVPTVDMPDPDSERPKGEEPQGYEPEAERGRAQTQRPQVKAGLQAPTMPSVRKTSERPSAHNPLQRD